MSLFALTSRAGITGLVLLVCLVSACGSDEADHAYAEGQKAYAQGDHARAAELFTKAIELDPDHAGAYLGRGMIYWRLMKHEQAVPDLTRAIELQPELILAYYFRGASRISLHKYEEGIADFTRVTASDVLPAEDLVRAHRWRGIALLNLERYEESIIDFTRCVDLQPDEPFHYVERGRVYEATGQIEKAKEDYKRYLALSQAEDGVTEEVRERLSSLEDPAPR